MAEPSKEISDEALIRVLGEYTDKADAIYQRHVSLLFRALNLCIVGMFMILFAIVNMFRYSDHFSTSVLIVVWGIPILIFAYSGSLVLPSRGHVERAAWQLRRIYQLVSSRENLGVRLDSGTRLELELRLSEAGFLLTQMKRFDRPEKFAAFRRVGPESPFRALEPDDSLLRFADPPASAPDAQNTTPA